MIFMLSNRLQNVSVIDNILLRLSKREILTFAITWMEVEVIIIMLSEISQRKIKLHGSLICRILQKKKAKLVETKWESASRG